jgi:5-carboxymethyl-2-hydroxymuconate isomerase
MPHLTLEYSANLRDSGNLGLLCRQLAACLCAQQENGKAVFPVGGVRVRALAAEDYCIADGRPDAAFVHATLKIGAGRSEAVRKMTGDALFDGMKSHFAALFEQSGLALSLEINEFSESGSWKHNNLHARFR